MTEQNGYLEEYDEFLPEKWDGLFYQFDLHNDVWRGLFRFTIESSAFTTEESRAKYNLKVEGLQKKIKELVDSFNKEVGL